MYLSLSLQVNSNLTLPLNLACAWMELKGLTLIALVLHATTFCRCLEVIHEMLRADSFKIGMHWQNMMRNTPTTSPQLISCLRSRNQDKSAQCGLLLSRTEVRTVHCYACVARYLSAECKREEHTQSALLTEASQTQAQTSACPQTSSRTNYQQATSAHPLEPLNK